MPERETVLGQWVSNQKARYRLGKLAEDRIQRLNEICFQWEPKIAAVESKFTELQAYRKKFGHCNVPYRTVLGTWVSEQRKRYGQGKLSVDRIRRFNALGLQWDVKDRAWDSKLAELQAYKTKFNDFNVSRNWKENKALANWIRNQRTAHRSNKLSSDRIQRLEEIGFQLDKDDVGWAGRCENT
jgi:hypothetical protein